MARLRVRERACQRYIRRRSGRSCFGQDSLFHRKPTDLLVRQPARQSIATHFSFWHRRGSRVIFRSMDYEWPLFCNHSSAFGPAKMNIHLLSDKLNSDPTSLCGYKEC